MKERIQKLLSAAGLCSRRQAEEYLKAGRIAVNGETASLGDKADWEEDRLTLDSRPVQPPRSEHLYLMLNKPRGCVTTLSDEKGRPTAAQLVKDCGQRVYPVGRLDMDSDGLLLFTNDGAFSQALTHPSHEIEKEYLVTVSGVLEGACERLEKIRTLEDGTRVAPAQVRLVERRGEQSVLSVVIHQGKNRQVRRMCALAGLQVHRLQRIREGSLRLGKLKSGKWRTLTDAEIQGLLGNKHPYQSANTKNQKPRAERKRIT